MKELTNEELIMRIAKTKASGLSASAYFKLMGFNKNYVFSARKQLHDRGVTDEHINADVNNRMGTLRYWMDKSPVERDEFVSLYHSYLERPKDVSEHQFCSEAGIGDYEFRKLRAGYKYFTDIFEKLDGKDAAATVNSGTYGPIQIVYNLKSEDKIDIMAEDAASGQFAGIEDFPIEKHREIVNKALKDLDEKTEKHSGRYPWGSDDPLPDGTNLDELTPGTYLPNGTTSAVSEDESIDESYDYFQHVIQIRMSRYIKDDLDRTLNIDIPYDKDNINQIFINISDLIDAFLTLR